jgi:hypothetical protein
MISSMQADKKKRSTAKKKQKKTCKFSNHLIHKYYKYYDVAFESQIFS